ncbi:MAG: S26 family signal peptidase [Bacteroidota bacterium]
MLTNIILLLLFIAFGAGLYKTFEKAGEAGWKSIVPGLNLYTWLQITGRPLWWLILILIPIVNIFVVVYMLIDLVKCFGKYGFFEHALAFLVPFAYLPYIGFNESEKYLGKSVEIEKENPRKKSAVREWSEAIIFAVFAATFIRMFLIEAYTIPTPSMENSLMVGDFLFVSKINYGSRMPMTPIQFPLVHNKLPFLKSESYSKAIQWDYRRIGGWQKVQRYEPVVFNFPEGDTVAFLQDSPEARKRFGGYGSNMARYLELMNRTHYYGHVRDYGQEDVNKFFKLVTRPIDKKDNYIKRCVGLPGDKIEIRERQLYVNDAEAQNPDGLQYMYLIRRNGAVLNQKKLKDEGISFIRIDGREYAFLTEDQVKFLEETGNDLIVEPEIMKSPDRGIFPHDIKNYPWNRDNLGPLVIPKAGETVDLNSQNIAMYRKLIADYEQNEFEIKDGQIMINGEPVSSYTFQMNYYWMMGDNRHNSEDSRVWGFVPEDHIVGKPLFIWLSLENGRLFGDGGIRWNRMFKGANDMD